MSFSDAAAARRNVSRSGRPFQRRFSRSAHARVVRRRSFEHVIVPLAAVAALVLVACADDGSDAGSGSTTVVAPTSAPPVTTASPPTTASAASGIDWTACDPGFECARVPVPLDWSDPTGRQIELAVIRYLATKPDQRIGAMFFNPGGPGESGVGVVRDSGPDLSAFGDGRFDVVSWDPRGTHASSPGEVLRHRRRRSGLLARTWPSRPRTSSRSPTRPRWSTSRSGAERSWATSCRTSRPPTRRATSTACAS